MSKRAGKSHHWIHNLLNDSFEFSPCSRSLGALAHADDALRLRLEAAAAPRIATFGAVELAALCWSHAVLARPVPSDRTQGETS